jgi:hypothetical protein
MSNAEPPNHAAVVQKKLLLLLRQCPIVMCRGELKFQPRIPHWSGNITQQLDKTNWPMCEIREKCERAQKSEINLIKYIYNEKKDKNCVLYA